MAQAIRTILKSGYNEKCEPLNPWTINYHLSDCENAIWADDGSLVEFGELQSPERPTCGACKHEWDLWQKLLKLGDGETGLGDIAFRGLSLAHRVLTFGFPKVEDLDGFDFDLLETAHTARNQFETWLTIERGKVAERTGK